ncbi:MAG: site-2 protease family protein [Desulfobacteraceae bacterium]
MDSPFPVPYIFNLSNFVVEDLIAFVLGILFAITINAEAQAFMAAILGDRREGAKDRGHFFFLFHMDPLGTLSFLVAGFGWPRQVAIDPGKFEYPRLYTVITRFAGPIANLAIAGIAASFIILMSIINIDPHLFLGVIAVNITVAVYNLLPLPPLAASYIISELLTGKFDGLKKAFESLGPYVLIGILLLDRIYDLKLFSPYFDPIIVPIYNFIIG